MACLHSLKFLKIPQATPRARKAELMTRLTWQCIWGELPNIKCLSDTSTFDGPNITGEPDNGYLTYTYP